MKEKESVEIAEVLGRRRKYKKLEEEENLETAKVLERRKYKNGKGTWKKKKV